MILLDYRDARPIYVQICDGFREQIVTGILRTDDKLPSVRELATQLTINPNTIQRSYRELELQGWVTTVPGKGCFVRGIPENQQTREEKLWEQLHQAVRKLVAIGFSREQIAREVLQGGNKNA